MQLSEAIDGWLAAHSAGLSGSTRRDIGDIAASADRCGYAWIDCFDVREHHLNEIVAEADASSSLNASAIGQFLEIAVEWAITQTEAAGVTNDLLPSDTDGWLDTKASPIVDDLDLDEISWVDDLPPVDDFDIESELAPAEPEPAEPEPVEPEPAEPDEDKLTAIDEDDFDEDELTAIDEDLTTIDEDDLDADELDAVDADLSALLDDTHEIDNQDLFVADGGDLFDDGDGSAAEQLSPSEATTSAFSTATAAGVPSDPAASSFLRTLEETGQTPTVFVGPASQRGTTDVDITAASGADMAGLGTDQAGIFSEAAQYDGGRSIDWITVAYFAVAAICFALVIYFYLSS